MSKTCKQCGKNVGCGCQLVNGLCSVCRNIKKGTKYVATKTFGLF